MKTGERTNESHGQLLPGSKWDSGESAPARLECRKAAEYLPWLITGALAEPKRSKVAEHLASCESCREDARETLWLATLALDEHLPTEVLVGRALDLDVDGWALSQIDSHLAVCSACRNELELVVSDPGLADVPQRKWRASGAGGRIRQWGLAATVAVVIGLTAVLYFAPPAEKSSDPLAAELPPFQPAELPSAMPVPATAFPAGDLFRDGFESGTRAEWADQNLSEESGDASS